MGARRHRFVKHDHLFIQRDSVFHRSLMQEFHIRWCSFALDGKQRHLNGGPASKNAALQHQANVAGGRLGRIAKVRAAGLCLFNCGVSRAVLLMAVSICSVALSWRCELERAGMAA